MQDGDADLIQAAGLDIYRVEGRIKWYDFSRGYGFVTPDDEGDDIFLHRKQLLSYGARVAYDGTPIVCDVLEEPGKNRVHRIIELGPVDRPEIEPYYPVEPESDWHRAVVKWYNRIRGYGFLVAKDQPDIFVHQSVVRQCQFATLNVGDFVQVRWGHGDRGLVAADLRPDDL